MELGFIGTGKMGYNMVLRLSRKGHKVLAHNRSPEPLYKLHKEGVNVAFTIDELMTGLRSPKKIWLMVSADAVEKVLELVSPGLSAGDIIIDGTDSMYKDSIKRYRVLKNIGADYLDAGIKGSPEDVFDGLILMVGGNASVFKECAKLFKDIAIKDGYAYLGEHGAGHYAKDVLNRIETNVRAELDKGLNMLSESEFGYDMNNIVKLFSKSNVPMGLLESE